VHFLSLADKATSMQVSHMAETLIGSEIIKLAGEINQKIKAGQSIYNFTIGDFDPAVFPIPDELNQEIRNAYLEGHTNYPAANGLLETRQAVAYFLEKRQHLSYTADEILISGGARPLIYAIYQTLLDPGDSVIFPVPSWNNNHYCHLSQAKPIALEVTAADNFMPTAALIAPHIQEATLIALCSPLNPTGTLFSESALREICELILKENKRRAPNQKPVYLMYDQIYWSLTYAGAVHVDPVSLFPEMREYTIYVDGLSKAFAATGVRVGWSFGPAAIIDKMKSILSHIGAWAPKAEQIAVARYLIQDEAVDRYFKKFRHELYFRLHGFYEGFQALAAAGHPVQCIVPQSAIYLTLQFKLIGKRTADGKILQNMREVTAYILDAASMAIVPFYAFGAPESSHWFRLSVGTCKREEVKLALDKLKKALEGLS
jgi:aspartate aminotransferase